MLFGSDEIAAARIQELRAEADRARLARSIRRSRGRRFGPALATALRAMARAVGIG